LARGLAAVPGVDLTVIVNVGDDEQVYGLNISPDLDTVVYTLAGVEGPEGWGRSHDRFRVMHHLAGFEVDTSFRLGDADLATNLFRTAKLAEGWPLSRITEAVARSFGLAARVLPATDDNLRTQLLTAGGWRTFQDYFVLRRHADDVLDIRFVGASESSPALGVLEALAATDAVIIGPSNPVLSIWPILAIPELAEAMEAAGRVLAVSPLFAGRALKGPADRVLAGFGYASGNRGVIEAYGGLITDFVIDVGDAEEANTLAGLVRSIQAVPTRISSAEAALRLGEFVIGLL
jgi:LPPG:FO 2-phospho-L-lactate transferase